MTYRDSWKSNIEGHDDLRRLHEELRSQIKERWDRVLPFGDELFDRWEKAENLNFGRGSSIYDSSVVIGDVSIGEDTWVGPFTVLDGSAGLVIGDHCSISAGVHIYTHDTVGWALTGGQSDKNTGSVVIGSNTYIGPNTVVALGVEIGDRCVIGSGSFVNSSIPDNTIAHGTPARPVGTVRVAGADVVFQYD